MDYKNQIKIAADEYRISTGFTPQQYDDSFGKSDAERLAALKRDIRWFDDHATEAKQRVERCLRNIYVEDLANK